MGASTIVVDVERARLERAPLRPTVARADDPFARRRLVAFLALGALCVASFALFYARGDDVERIPRELTLVEGTKNELTLVERARRASGGAVSTPRTIPTTLSPWWSLRFFVTHKNMPVYESANADAHEVIVIGHAASWALGKTWYASLRGKNVGVKITGLGTSYSGFADKLIGLRAALSATKGDHLFVFSDTTDVLFLCRAREIVDRLNAIRGFTFLSSAQPKNWPVVPGSDYFETMTEANAFKDAQAQKVHDVGVAGGFENARRENERKWANSGMFAARREALERYLEYIENDLVKFGKKACKPFGMSDADFVNGAYEHTTNRDPFDDQLCMNSYLQSRFAAGDEGVFLDEDGAIFLSTGDYASADHFLFPEFSGTTPAVAQDASLVYRRTGARPCAVHFNGVASHAVLHDVLAIFPALAPEFSR